MHLQHILTFVFALCITLVIGQERECAQLRRRCNECVATLNNDNDRNLPAFNRECAIITQRTWHWRNLSRCDMTWLNCLGWESRMNCGEIAEKAGMRRRRND
ncbi:uncharacterized protein LOC108096162 [Drosophila ficusphila]|uniref:uncharacterized protein LOC108096162 n=1 Tax=Drosophila ficusphila TaxID=30025 RepID=UPI0007E6D2E8|nr:uncharacterized protein LOC108096162 [Drosophila ficusphila]